MTYTLLHADRATTLLADDPVVPAVEREAFGDALALLAAATRLHDGHAADLAAAIEAGRQEGRAIGYRDGRAAGADEAAAQLLQLAERDRAREAGRRAEIARLAIEVVRRIAGEVGEPAMVAAIADRAVTAVAGAGQPGAVTLRVSPAALAATQARLAGRSGVSVEPDGELAAGDCVIVTALGRAHAGLATQLDRIERGWTGTDAAG